MPNDPSLAEIRRLAYDRTPGVNPGIVFLSGFNSTKEGTKAVYLEEWARKTGRACLRFDYSGHGVSQGDFRDGTISAWAEDAAQIIQGLTQGPQVIVGSSMGGWIACLLAQRMPERFAGLVTIAAAPDFTEERYWSSFDDDARAKLDTDGFVEVETPYDDKPYVITKSLIEDGRQNTVLTKPLSLPFPTRILHGTADEAVPVATAERLFKHAKGPDIRLLLVKGADHRFSSPECLDIITDAIDEIAPIRR